MKTIRAHILFICLAPFLGKVNVTIACCDICSSYAKMGRDRYCHLPRTAVNTKWKKINIVNYLILIFGDIFFFQFIRSFESLLIVYTAYLVQLLMNTWIIIINFKSKFGYIKALVVTSKFDNYKPCKTKRD